MLKRSDCRVFNEGTLYRGVSKMKETVKHPWARNNWKRLPPQALKEQRKELFSQGVTVVAAGEGACKSVPLVEKGRVEGSGERIWRGQWQLRSRAT